MCGEKTVLFLSGFPVLGSPPHVRGKEEYLQETESIDRITPACAGKRCCSLCLRFPDWDHPRMCGEKSEGEQRC